MVILHQSVKNYAYGPKDFRDLTHSVNTALRGVGEFVKAAIKAVPEDDESQQQVDARLFRTYFGDTTQEQRRNIWNKLQKLKVLINEDSLATVDVTIHVGTLHLCTVSNLYVSELNEWLDDFGLDTSIQDVFDEHGHIDLSKEALRSPSVGECMFHKQKGDLRAFTEARSRPVYHIRGGRRIHLNPALFMEHDHLAPCEFDGGPTAPPPHIHVLKWYRARLPAVLLHEFGHTYLQGEDDDWLKDEALDPSAFPDNTNRTQIGLNQGADLQKPQTIYGNKLCRFAAQSRQWEKTHTNSDSYMLFALAAYMYHKEGWDFGGDLPTRRPGWPQNRTPSTEPESESARVHANGRNGHEDNETVGLDGQNGKQAISLGSADGEDSAGGHHLEDESRDRHDAPPENEETSTHASEEKRGTKRDREEDETGEGDEAAGKKTKPMPPA